MCRENLLIYCPTRLLAVAIPTVIMPINNSVRMILVRYTSIELVNSTYNSTATKANPNIINWVPPPFDTNIRIIIPTMNIKIARVDAYASVCCTVGDATYDKFNINPITNKINTLYFLSFCIFIINYSEVDVDILNIY